LNLHLADGEALVSDVRPDGIVVDVLALHVARGNLAVGKPRLEYVELEVKSGTVLADVLDVCDERIEPPVAVVRILEHAVVVTVQLFGVERHHHGVLQPLVGVVVSPKLVRTA
jgi:hypothetical protein